MMSTPQPARRTPAAFRHCAWILAGFLLTLVQGHAALEAAELPQVLTGINARFAGAELPVVTGNNMVINQTADKATLHWQSFNIGAGGQVEFKQPGTTSVALNRIFDGLPSQIQGQLKANGQVYLINQNGIVFGDGAQVNTQSLIASTLDIDDRVYQDIGFVNAINNGALADDALPAFDGKGQPMGQIRINEGATLEAAKNGRILVFAPSIVNEGTLRTPEGQTILAAAEDQVYLAASTDPSLRGLLVEVSTGGDVTNLGNIIAERGNITLLGLAVNQSGVARATTSVSLNGSVRLLAQDMDGTVSIPGSAPPRVPLAQRGGTLTLGAGSVTEVVPDTARDADGNEILGLDAQTQSRSRVELAGTQVRIGSNARVTSTGGDISIAAGRNPRLPDLAEAGGPASEPASVVIEAGAVLDASGDDTTTVSVARNIVNVEARGNELADSPVQRDGPLRNETLQVDVRQGTDFLNIDGAVAAIGRTAAERQSAGGSISIQSEGSLVLAAGARLDASGGKVTYTDGYVSTSRLRRADGTVVDISRADPRDTYLGLAPTYLRREAGYVEGKDAGSLLLSARGLTLEGTLAAGAITGVHQRRQAADLVTGSTPAFARPWDQVPLGGALAVNLRQSGLPSLVVGTAPAGGPAPALVLSPALLEASGATRIGLANAGDVVLNGDLSLPAWSSLSLTGTQVVLEGNLRMPGGQLTLNSSNAGIENQVPDEDLLTRIDGTVDLSGTWVNDNPLLNRIRPTAPLVLDGGRIQVNSGASIVVGPDSVLDVSAGAWRSADGRFTGGRGGTMGFVTGELEDPVAGSFLDLAGELRGYGFTGGGELRLDVERLEILGAAGTSPVDLDGGRQFGLREVTDDQGRRQYILGVAADTFQQGGFGAYLLNASRADLRVAAGADVLLRTASYQLGGSQPALVPTGTPVSTLATPVFLPDFARPPARLVLSATNDRASAIGPVADLRLEAGARIRADAGSEVSLLSTTSLFVDGAIDAPAGTINLVVGGGPGVFQPGQMLWLGAEARLNANGAALVDTQNLRGLRLGEVLDAGRIHLRARQGSLVAAAGARVAADGVTAVLDLGAGIPRPTTVAGAAGTIELAAAESLLFQGALSARAPAGTTAPGGRLIVALDPTRRGVQPLLSPDGIPRGPHTLVVQDYTGVLPGPGQAVDPALQSTGYVPLSQVQAGGFDALDLVVRSSAVSFDGTSGAPVPDTRDSLPVIRFPGDLDLNLRRSIVVDAAVLETPGARVTLTAPYVALGYSDPRVRLDGAIPDKISATSIQDDTVPLRLTPTAGTGTLAVHADLIELVGEAVTRGFGDAAQDLTGVSLVAREDLRLRGVRKVLAEDYSGYFRTAGHLHMDARRIYPATLTDFTLGVEGPGGRLSLAGGGGGAVAAPLSVGGRLTLTADEIIQGGALYAPLGELNLVAGETLRFTPGSLTSTSAVGVAAPFFRTEPGGALILPAPSLAENQIVFVDGVVNPAFERLLPEKRVNLSAPGVALEEGSRFDLRGGGDIAATEFVPGPGGSRDILLAAEADGAFAIVPGAGSFAPYDPLETPAAELAEGLRIGDTLILEEGLAGLPAGEYAILPARYALFGGYLVTPTGARDLAPGQGGQARDGAPILAGRFGVAGNDTADSRSQGFIIEDGTRVRRRAEYLETDLDDLYAGGLVRAPRDAGNLVIDAGGTLQLQGELIRAGAAAGQGSAVDIATTAALRVVNEFSGLPGIELRAADLENLGADSLLLGGTRQRTAGGLAIDARSSSLNVVAGVDLAIPELILVAGAVTVDATPGTATRLASSAPATTRGESLLLAGDAALLAVSDRRLAFARGAGDTQSRLDVASGARIEAAGSLVLDAAGDVNVAADLAVADGALLSLGAARLSLGETEGQAIAGGLILSNTDLAALAGSDLRLRSQGFMDLYGEIRDPATGGLLEFQRLSLDAPGLRGLANGDRTAVLAAGDIEIRNSTGMGLALSQEPTAPGSRLQLLADGVLSLAGGSFAVQGVESVTLAAGGGLVITAGSDLGVAGNLQINAPLITAAGATDSRIRVTGLLGVNGGDAAAPLPVATGLGARLELAAADLDFAGRIVLPSGSVRLTQTGDPAVPMVGPMVGAGLRLGSGALLDVAGRNQVYGPRTLGTPGGSIFLTAATGDLVLGEGVVLDAAGAPAGGEGGGIHWQAPLGAVRFGPDLGLRAAGSGGTTGRFSLDSGTLAGLDGDPLIDPLIDPLGALANLLGAGGFRDSIALRLRQQDLSLEAGSVLAARELRLTADTGSLQVAGVLDASGTAGGRIQLAAGDGLELTGTLLARGGDAGAAGGRVDLHALDADGDDPLGTADTVHLREGSLIDVSGGAGGAGGQVFVHVRRLDADGDGQTDQRVTGELAGTVTGAGRAQLLATRVLRDPNATQVTDPVSGALRTLVTLGSSQISAWRTETENFLASQGTGPAGPLELAAALQVESTGDLVLAGAWDFQQGWHFGQDLSDPTAPVLGRTGTVTLRAAGNLDLQADLTDAFGERLLFGFIPVELANGAVNRLDDNGNVVEQRVPGAWGYRLAAGADLASADVLAFGARTGAGAGGLTLGTGVRVRTGTADIDVASAGDVRLRDGASLYTAGRDLGLSAQLEAALAPSTIPFGLNAYDFLGTFLNGGQFPVNGGTVTVTGGGSLSAQSAPGPVTGWLTRVGSGVPGGGLYDPNDGYGAVPTHWAVAFRQFRNGIGAFGGGDLRVAVAGDVTQLALVAPTTGRVTDGVVADTAGGLIVFQPSVRSTEILGGGVLDVRAGGHLNGGQVLLGRGTGRVRTGGSTGNVSGPLVYLGGDASVDWVAGGNLALAGIQDPTVAPLSDSQLELMVQIFAGITSTSALENGFYTYTGDSRVTLAALGGDVTLDGPGFGGFLPPSLTAVAHGGDLNVVATPIEFFPAPTAQLELLARDNITGNFTGSPETRLRQSDQDRGTLPSVDRPDLGAGAPIPARVPVHTADPLRNLIIARDGSVRSQPGQDGYWNLELAKATLIQAGLDISNLAVRVQNIAATDITSFEAGRDINQGDLRDATGRFNPNDRRRFEIWGPGSAEFVAGRNISLGTSAGIETVGNAANPALAATGASLRLLAGTGGDLAYDRFIDVYLSPEPSEYRDRLNAFLAELEGSRTGFHTSSEEERTLPIEPGAYAKALGEFLAEYGIPVGEAGPVAAFRALDRPLQRAFITRTVFAELKEWGSASETASRADRLNYVRGFTALDTLFAGTDPLGDRAVSFPPGSIGAAVQDYLTEADPRAANDAQVALFGSLFPERPRQGDISLLLSQVQTLAGGDLAMLAPGGDINAGAADADIIAKQPADLGIVTARAGDIDIYADRDLLVNSTRVFALQGDLLIWSSNGNIDAGKGAKTVTSIPDPITRIDPNTGNTLIEFPPAVAGSGLQGENAALFAPRGAVNAGDAGIRTNGDLTIGAVEIVGTDNIDVGGVEIGFSTTDVVAVAPPAAASATSAATKGLDSQASLLGEANELGERTLAGTEVKFIRVEVLSFGEGACDPDREDCG